MPDTNLGHEVMLYKHFSKTPIEVASLDRVQRIDEKRVVFNFTMRLLMVLVCCCLALPVFSQQRKNIRRPQSKTRVVKSQKVAFNFKILSDLTFKRKDGTNNFYVINFPKKTAHQLYMDILSHIASIYSNPDYVTSKVEDRTIVVNGYARDITSSKDYGGSFIAIDLEYKLNFQFKDGRIRINAPIAQDIYSRRGSHTNKVSEYGDITSGYLSVLGTKSSEAEKDINEYINKLISTIIYGVQDDNW